MATGVAIWIWLAIIGVDFAMLWGLVAFLLNYVPNIGSIIAAIPAILLALIQLGVVPALLTCLGYVVVNVVFGSILEPKLWVVDSVYPPWSYSFLWFFGDGS